MVHDSDRGGGDRGSTCTGGKDKEDWITSLMSSNAWLYFKYCITYLI